MGGNGFYWRIARHSEDSGLLEIRRAEDGLRAWASEPGEYYNAFDGTYGGLWRRSGRAPQQLVGIGFTAQGVFTGMPYHRSCHDPAFDWVFDGIEGDVIGDLNRRRGMIQGQEPGPTGVRVKASAPLSEMFGYIGDLRTMTSGRGQFSMEFSHYDPTPRNVAEEVIKDAKERKAAKG